jgi:hypothetical protein
MVSQVRHKITQDDDAGVIPCALELGGGVSQECWPVSFLAPTNTLFLS